MIRKMQSIKLTSDFFLLYSLFSLSVYFLTCFSFIFIFSPSHTSEMRFAFILHSAADVGYIFTLRSFPEHVNDNVVLWGRY